MVTMALIALATALVVICGFGACGCAWAWRRHFARRRAHARLLYSESRSSPRGAGRSRGGCCEPRQTETPKETRLESLQRRFVAGEITLDEYERGIDRMIRSARPA
jgi:hypothetical protein